MREQVQSYKETQKSLLEQMEYQRKKKMTMSNEDLTVATTATVTVKDNGGIIPEKIH